MSHLKKKQRRMTSDETTEEEATVTDQVTADDLSTDLLANILGFLGGVSDIVHKRRVCKKWKEAAKITLVPLCNFYINNMKRYNSMRVMTEALPNLQQLEIGDLGYPHKWNDGEDPDGERAARYARRTAHDIGIISNFSKLRILSIHPETPSTTLPLIVRRLPVYLNGRYPFLFSSFPLLQKLRIYHCNYLKWDLDMLAGFPMLKELDCVNNECLTGNIRSLRVLKGTLEMVIINNSNLVEGNFMELADFPHLKELVLDDTAVTGDIRDIGENDFSSLEELSLPKSVYGGWGYEFQRISDAPDLVRAVYLFRKQRPSLEYLWYGQLSEDSPDWYDSADDEFVDYSAPFHIWFVEAGSRIGYRWDADDYGRNSCEVNWLDPEPDRESDDIVYGEYARQLRQIDDDVYLYKGFHQPPTEEEYQRLVEER